MSYVGYMGAGLSGRQHVSEGTSAREKVAGGQPASSSGPPAYPPQPVQPSAYLRPAGYREPASTIVMRLHAVYPDWPLEPDGSGWKVTRGEKVIRRKALVAIELALELELAGGRKSR